MAAEAHAHHGSLVSSQATGRWGASQVGEEEVEGVVEGGRAAVGVCQKHLHQAGRAGQEAPAAGSRRFGGAWAAGRTLDNPTACAGTGWGF